ncbi:XRE family transcriptional regulator [Bdellovibrio svalbardensis]|uniref:Helix-turn-helix domain-containing protein n=1 Tax=Bdellovibrio svalbardensis TaxID=2972972 RepID=A0ABT6DNE4_9BACT|nr:XRE family transcriptional regulator [Bdellovibrio svalbardensis]MDG0817625.1 helix-turn-helix domain-containing protein [Bdellovibrio svalbardensis]
MKKVSKKPSKISKAPPPGWPSEEVVKEFEKKTRKSLVTKLLPPNPGLVEYTKQTLCEHFIRYRRDENITQRELAKRLDVTENRVSEILHYHHQTFTIDRLIELLSRIKPDVRIKVA